MAKFDTPILRARPSTVNSSHVCQVETKSPSLRVMIGTFPSQVLIRLLLRQ
jgi:hypothetical protein